MAVRKAGAAWPRLTQAQQELVQANVGLVAVHLRRHVPGLAQPRRDREYDDLFQEGCMGLMQAAARWDERSGIPFAAFAFPRIHNAISMGIRSKFLTVYVPPRHGDTRSTKSKPVDGRDAAERPREGSLSDGQLLALPAGSSPGQDDPAGETIGDRVREKYERAVAQAVNALQGGASTRGDRDELLRVLARERLLVPSEELRRPLRQIARDTQSSYARVAQCATQLSQQVKRHLDEDPEFAELLRQARSTTLGMSAPVDGSLERALRDAGAREFTRRFTAADKRDRGLMLYTLLERTHADLCGLVRTRFHAMSRSDREGLWHPVTRRAGAGAPGESRARKPLARAGSRKRHAQSVTV